MQSIFIKKCFLFTNESVCRIKRFITGSKNSLKDDQVADDPRPGRPVEIAIEATVRQVEELIRADRRITIDSAATALWCSHGLAYSIMHDRLKFRKCARWVARELKNRENINRMCLSLQRLLRYADEEDASMFNRVVTGDESCMHHYQPKSELASMQ
jgi:hypothetical protein